MKLVFPSVLCTVCLKFHLALAFIWISFPWFPALSCRSVSCIFHIQCFFFFTFPYTFTSHVQTLFLSSQSVFQPLPFLWYDLPTVLWPWILSLYGFIFPKSPKFSSSVLMSLQHRTVQILCLHHKFLVSQLLVYFYLPVQQSHFDSSMLLLKCFLPALSVSASQSSVSPKVTGMFYLF